MIGKLAEKYIVFGIITMRVAEGLPEP